MKATEILKHLLDQDTDNEAIIDMDVEADPAWFPKGQNTNDPFLPTEEGEAQAVILLHGKRYCISIEELL